MFSQTAEYALRVIAYLGGLGDRPAVGREIAAATRVPEGYLAKVLQSLSRAGLVRSQRGLHGGSALARPADQITLYDVIQSVDPIRRITTCPLGLKSHGANLCPVHRRLDDAYAMIEETFRASTIADMLSEESSSKPLCDALAAPAAATAADRHTALTVRGRAVRTGGRRAVRR
jgi:Rrf2 family transcriptional regulator, nitric oxide-sensitive transcriptional repressor